MLVALGGRLALFRSSSVKNHTHLDLPLSGAASTLSIGVLPVMDGDDGVPYWGWWPVMGSDIEAQSNRYYRDVVFVQHVRQEPATPAKGFLTWGDPR